MQLPKTRAWTQYLSALAGCSTVAVTWSPMQPGPPHSSLFYLIILPGFALDGHLLSRVWLAPKVSRMGKKAVTKTRAWTQAPLILRGCSSEWATQTPIKPGLPHIHTCILCIMHCKSKHCYPGILIAHGVSNWNKFK